MKLTILSIMIVTAIIASERFGEWKYEHYLKFYSIPLINQRPLQYGCAYWSGMQHPVWWKTSESVCDAQASQTAGSTKGE